MPYSSSEKKRAYNKKYAAENRDRIAAVQKRRHLRCKRRLFAVVDDYRLQKGCERCGRKDLPACAYDFHHRDPATKTAHIHVLVHRGNEANLRTEMEKCVVLCACCHRIVHYEQSSLSC